MKHTVTISTWIFGVLILTNVVLALIIWSDKRRRKPNLKQGATDEASLCSTVAGLTQATLVKGNQVEIVQNGEFFDSVFRDLEEASSNINIETFLCKCGEVTRRLTDVLVRKAAQGVEVRLLLDGSGGRNYGDDDIKRMKQAGCAVRPFHPFLLSNLGRFNNRTHRKIVVIDGRIGYVGGHCLVDTWLGKAEDKEHFRDISARVQGPVITQLQSAFTDHWIEETGEVISGGKFFPVLNPVGKSDAHIVFVSPVGGPTTLELLHYIAIMSATESITLQNPYFLPDTRGRDALLEAAARGVNVRVMIPDVTATDSPLVQHASHHHYGTLLKGGVRIFDYQHTLLHQKVFTVDHKWSSIGSTNFDHRSFDINDEVSMVVFDEDIARELEETFEKDLQYATERTLKEWMDRPVLHKLKDGSAFLMRSQL